MIECARLYMPTGPKEKCYLAWKNGELWFHPDFGSGASNKIPVYSVEVAEEKKKEIEEQYQIVVLLEKFSVKGE